MNIKPVFIGFDYASETLLKDLQKNVHTLLGTPEGTVPGDRHYGINQNFVGMPGPIMQNLLSLEIVEKIEEYEPRLTVKDITFQHDLNGHIEALVLLATNPDYEEPGYGDEEEYEALIEEEVE